MHAPHFSKHLILHYIIVYQREGVLGAQVIIREMHQGDLDTVIKLAMLANPFTTEERYRQHLLEELMENPDLSFVAVKDDRVVGYVQADVRNSDAVLEDIAVAVEHQKKGIGKKLLNEELRALELRKTKIIVAEVHYKCAAAIPFYYKYNFRITHFEQDYFGAGHDAIILKLIL